MSATTLKNGNTMSFDEDKYIWKYNDGEPGDLITRPCPKCGNLPTIEGFDFCLGHLPGVKNACCGHGSEGYIQFKNGLTVRGIFKIESKPVNPSHDIIQSLGYKIVIEKKSIEDGGGFEMYAPIIKENCRSHGDTLDECYAKLCDKLELIINVYRANDLPIPIDK